jgi:hypothetical protein
MNEEMNEDTRPRLVVNTRGTKREPRYSAEFRGGPYDGHRVEDKRSPEDAIGSLIRSVIESLDSADAVMEFLASLFGDLRYRSANVILARAVWIHASSPKRANPGVDVHVAARSGRRLNPSYFTYNGV